MFKKMSALLWLRNQILLSNKNLIVQILLPYALVFLYKNFMGNQSSGREIMFVCLSTAISMSVGSMISTIIAEEKEKNNLKSLLLSGVGYPEYISSVLIHPILITIITMITFPLITEVHLENMLWEYVTVVFLTSLAVMLINLCIGLISETQSKAQMNSLPLLFIVALLPMFSTMKESLKGFVNLTFMGAYTNLFTLKDFSLEDPSVFILVAWDILLLIVTVLALSKGKKTSQSKIIYLKKV